MFAVGLSQESQWQQLSSDLQDFSQYSGRSEKCWTLNILDPSPISNNSSDFFPHFFGDSSECANYYRYHRHLHVPLFFSPLARNKYLSLFLLSFIFSMWYAEKAKSTWRKVFVFLFYLFIYLFIHFLFGLLTRSSSGLLSAIRGSVCAPIYYYYLLLAKFSQLHWLVVFLRSLRDRKSPKVSKIFLCILADLDNAVVCVDPFIFYPSGRFSDCYNCYNL